MTRNGQSNNRFRGSLASLLIVAWLVQGCRAAPVVYTLKSPMSQQVSRAAPIGAHVQVTVGATLRSFDDSPDRAKFFVQHDVRDAQGKIVIAAGSPVSTVLTVQEEWTLGRPALIRIDLVGTVDVRGDFVHLMGSTELKGKSRVGRVAGLTVGLFFLMGPFSLFFLFLDGEKLELATGEMLAGVVVPEARAQQRTTHSNATGPHREKHGQKSRTKDTRTVTYDSNCIVRQRPTKSSRRIGSLVAGKRYDVIRSKGRWRLVALPSEAHGWVGCTPK